MTICIIRKIAINVICFNGYIRQETKTYMQATSFLFSLIYTICCRRRTMDNKVAHFNVCNQLSQPLSPHKQNGTFYNLEHNSRLLHKNTQNPSCHCFILPVPCLIASGVLIFDNCNFFVLMNMFRCIYLIVS